MCSFLCEQCWHGNGDNICTPNCMCISKFYSYLFYSSLPCYHDHLHDHLHFKFKYNANEKWFNKCMYLKGIKDYLPTLNDFLFKSLIAIQTLAIYMLQITIPLEQLLSVLLPTLMAMVSKAFAQTALLPSSCNCISVCWDA